MYETLMHMQRVVTHKADLVCRLTLVRSRIKAIRRLIDISAREVLFGTLTLLMWCLRVQIIDVAFAPCPLPFAFALLSLCSVALCLCPLLLPFALCPFASKENVYTT